MKLPDLRSETRMGTRIGEWKTESDKGRIGHGHSFSGKREPPRGNMYERPPPPSLPTKTIHMPRKRQRRLPFPAKNKVKTNEAAHRKQRRLAVPPRPWRRPKPKPGNDNAATTPSTHQSCFHWMQPN